MKINLYSRYRYCSVTPRGGYTFEEIALSILDGLIFKMGNFKTVSFLKKYRNTSLPMHIINTIFLKKDRWAVFNS